MRVKYLLWVLKFDFCDMNILKVIVVYFFCDDIDNKSWNWVYKISVVICIFKKKKFFIEYNIFWVIMYIFCIYKGC